MKRYIPILFSLILHAQVKIEIPDFRISSLSPSESSSSVSQEESSNVEEEVIPKKTRTFLMNKALFMGSLIFFT